MHKIEEDGTETDLPPGSSQSQYPLIEDIDFDMDTTEYEIYRCVVHQYKKKKLSWFLQLDIIRLSSD